jgi:hypothetical protein
MPRLRDQSAKEKLAETGGEGGIRTLGTVTRTTVFETVPIDHSGTSPQRCPLPGRAEHTYGLAASQGRARPICADEIDAGVAALQTAGPSEDLGGSAPRVGRVAS